MRRSPKGVEGGRQRGKECVMFSRLLAAFIAASLLSSDGSAIARPNPHARTVASWLLQYHAEGLRYYHDPDPRYAVAYVDLNGDGVDEAIVYFQSRGTCGSGGCRLFVLASRGRLWRRVSGHTITNLPIRLLPTRHYGWRDISVRVRGGGIRQAYDAALPFDGRTYPLNPSMPPARRLPRHSRARILIGENTPLIPLQP
jgi:hypothetical protein